MSSEKQHIWGAENNEIAENESKSNEQVSKTQSARQMIEINLLISSYFSIFKFSSVHLIVYYLATSNYTIEYTHTLDLGKITPELSSLLTLSMDTLRHD